MIAKFPVLTGISCLTILVDHDESGQRAAQQCAQRWLSAGREVVCLTPRAAGHDFNDIRRAAR
jgi:Toprim domain-containing protein